MCEKFIFSKFTGLQVYSQQLYYQMNSITGIFGGSKNFRKVFAGGQKILY